MFCRSNMQCLSSTVMSKKIAGQSLKLQIANLENSEKVHDPPGT